MNNKFKDDAGLSRDATTEMMLDAWAEHRAAGNDAPDAEEWARMDRAWRTLIGVRLANDAIERYEGRFDGD